MEREKPLFEMRGISKRFGGVVALEDVDFSVHSGEVVGLVGDNGAGKSTLMKIAVGVFRPDEGEIYLRGEKIEFSSVMDARKRGIDIVYQDKGTIDSMDIVQNIFLGREIVRGLGLIKIVSKKEMKKKAVRLLKDLNLDIGTLDKETRFCSGGEIQGIELARAMYSNSDVILLDEPTTALSIKGTGVVLNYIKHLAQTGKGIVFIGHNLYHVYPVAHTFVLLSHGRVKKVVKKKDVSLKELGKILVS